MGQGCQFILERGIIKLHLRPDINIPDAIASIPGIEVCKYNLVMIVVDFDTE